MTIEKSYIELTPDSGDLFTAALSTKKKTGLAVYVIDGSFTTSMLAAPDMDGADFAEMRDLTFKSEYSDLTKQPTPLFFFTQSKTFCMNFVPLYLSSSFSTVSAACGMFQPTVVELHKSTGTGARAEFDYDSSTKVYIVMSSTTRGNQSISSHIQYGSITLSRPSKYGYDLDPKSATKSVSLDSWKYGYEIIGSGSKSVINMTDDYVFKFGTVVYPGRSGKLSSFAANSQKISDSESSISAFIDISTYIGGFSSEDSIGMDRRGVDSNKCTILSSKLNIPSNLFDSTNSKSFAFTKTLTPQAVTGKSYICYTMNIYGTGELLIPNQQSTAVSSAGSVYTASGSNLASNNATLVDKDVWQYPLRIVAKESDISGKVAIIKTASGYGMTLASEAETYKVATKNSYYTVRSKAGTNTREEQRYMYAQGAADDTNMKMSGFMQSVIDVNGSSFSDSYTVGACLLATDRCNLYVLYDDQSIAVSSYSMNISGLAARNRALGLKLSADGKNLTVHTAYASQRFAGGVGLYRITTISGAPANGQFAVPENTGTKKVEAVGLISDGKRTGYQDSSFPFFGVSATGTYLILEPKA